MTLVRSRLVDPSGSAVVGLEVIAHLVSPSQWLADGSGQVTFYASTTTDDQGYWQLDLKPQSSYATAGTFYSIREKGHGVSYIVVPNPGVDPLVPVKLSDHLVDPSTLVPEGTSVESLFLLRSELGVASGVAPLGVDGLVPAVHLPVSSGGTGSGVSDHGALTGLADDDHPQYHNDVRGDARYSQLGHTHSYAPVVHSHVIGDTTGLQVALDGKAAASHNHDGVYAPAAHTHLVADVSGLQVALDGKSPTTHNHDGAYDPAGTASAAVSAHAGEADPHPQYLTQTEGDGRYALAGSGGAATGEYPISAYGLISAACHPESAKGSSGLAFSIVRMHVPAGKAITAAGFYNRVARTVASVGLRAFAVYDDAGALVAETPQTDSLATAEGWRFATFSTPIAAQASDRFVLVYIALGGYDFDPSVPYSTGSHVGQLNGGYGAAATSNLRNRYTGGISSFPATISSATGTQSEYLPLIGLA